jgi:flap endonuclease-1
MGLPLKDIAVKKSISIEDLHGKKVAVDTYNVLYQFISAIRQRDGTPLTDKNGKITSHLNGIFYRTMKLIKAGIQPCFVFDGVAPELKAETQQSRRDIKSAAEVKYKEALAKGDLETARKFAQQSSKLNSEMISEAKELISAMGLPVIQALGDAEAQAAYMAQHGKVWAVVSQDYDSLLFGSPRTVRNLTISQKKRGGKIITPEILILSDTLNEHKIDLPKLINAGILVGTDFNKGIRGIGPKTAIKIVKENRFAEYESDIPRLKAVQNIFLKPAVTDNYIFEWKPLDVKKIKEIMCERHGFGEERVNTALGLKKSDADKSQMSLGDF